MSVENFRHWGSFALGASASGGFSAMVAQWPVAVVIVGGLAAIFGLAFGIGLHIFAQRQAEGPVVSDG